MKHNIKHISWLLPLAGIMLTSCVSHRSLRQTTWEKAQDDNPVAVYNEKAVSDKHVEELPSREYNPVKDEQNVDYRLDALFDMAQKGFDVTYTENGRLSSTAPQGDNIEIVVFKTIFRSTAKTWVKRMSRQGYAITVSYDADTKVYICTAKRAKK